uniref:Uncharacterized protein n=1 Tax=Rhizophora mucronata TaxID=61149 RepID=A0A2P2P8J2_RHIMU
MYVRLVYFLVTLSYVHGIF